MTEITWLGEPECHDVRRVGAKAANISQMAAAYNVPRGFALTGDAFNRWSPEATVDNIPRDFAAVVAEAYGRLAGLVGESEPAVAVRSSATDEDAAGTSFAGQHDTYLNVRGPDDIAIAIVKCWASLNNEEAVEYRKIAGLSIDDAHMAVLVQHMVAADSSGVAFSANPVSGNRDEVMINMSWGLGESVVSGHVTPDTYIVSKAGHSIISETIADKAVMTVSTPGGAREVDVPRIMRSARSGTPEQVAAVAQLASSLEERLGWAVDAEFAIKDGELYLLQARPITTL